MASGHSPFFVFLPSAFPALVVSLLVVRIGAGPCIVGHCAMEMNGAGQVRRGIVWMLCWAGVVLTCFAPILARAAETTDIYIGAYGVGAFLEDRMAHVEGTNGLATNLRSGAGLGLRIGIFPDFTKRMVGVELEYFGAYQRQTFSFAENGTVTQGQAGLLVTNSMTNLVLRRPTGRLRPYVGIGIGYSSGWLRNPSIPGRTTQEWESTASLATQYLVGVQGEVTERLYLFVEYKRLAADFHWQGFAQDVRANYLAVGIGLLF